MSIYIRHRFVIISGCSGGGKSTLLQALEQRGHSVVEEPGRRIVAEEIARGGTALPWIDGAAFARRTIEMALADWRAAEALAGWVFFDRGLIDAVAALQHFGSDTSPEAHWHSRRYHRLVFLAPPWPEIYVNDDERRHDFAEAIAEYERLAEYYPALGYKVVILPKISVETRVDFVLARLNHDG